MARLSGGNRILTINVLSPSAVKSCAIELEKIKQEMHNRFAHDFIQASLEYLLRRAKHYLRDGYPEREGNDKLQAVLNAFEIKNDGKIGRLSNHHSQAQFIEFGVGVVGENYSHEDAEKFGYEYNVPSEPKEKATEVYEKWASGERKVSPKIARQFGGIEFENEYLWFWQGNVSQGFEPQAFMFRAWQDYYTFGEYKKIAQEAMNNVKRGGEGYKGGQE